MKVVMHPHCIFCKIIARQAPATIIDENEHCLVIKDIAPKAPIHYLIILKKHVANLYDLEPQDMHLMQSITAMAQKLGRQLSQPQAFRLVHNNGAAAGQIVFHMHVHFLANLSAVQAQQHI